MSTTIKHLILPAAGLGTRMRAVNPQLPKELLPLGGRPAIYLAMEEAIAAGIEQVILIIRPGKEALLNAVSGMGLKVTPLYQKSRKGEMDAVALAEPLVAGHPVAILYPDNVVLSAHGPGALRALVEVYQAFRIGVVALTEVKQEDSCAWSNSGRVDLTYLTKNLCQIKNLHSKGPGYYSPRFSGELRCLGLWVAGPSLFDHIRHVRPTIEPGQEFTDGPVRQRMLTTEGMLGLRCAGTAFDVGNPVGYQRCRGFYQPKPQPP